MKNSTINKITLKQTEYKIDLCDEIKQELYDEFIHSLSKVPVLEHKCNSCGGIIEMDADKHIFVCPYCGTTYAIGTTMINEMDLINR